MLDRVCLVFGQKFVRLIGKDSLTGRELRIRNVEMGASTLTDEFVVVVGK